MLHEHLGVVLREQMQSVADHGLHVLYGQAVVCRQQCRQPPLKVVNNLLARSHRIHTTPHACMPV